MLKEGFAPHFPQSELEVTGKNIPNKCPVDLLINLRKCSWMLEDARAVLSAAAGQECSIYVSSGYRSKEVNEAIRGASKTSAHMEALGVDIVADPKLFNLRQTFDVLRKHPFFMEGIDQMVIERGCVHLGLPLPRYGNIPRHELRLDVDVDGVRKYPLWAIWPKEGK